MINVLIAVQIAAIAGVIISVIQLIRLHFLSKIIHFAIDETFSRRMAALDSGVKHPEFESIKYPDIDATYANLKWYKPWQRPSTLLVYDKEDQF